MTTAEPRALTLVRRYRVVTTMTDEELVAEMNEPSVDLAMSHHVHDIDEALDCAVEESECGREIPNTTITKDSLLVREEDLESEHVAPKRSSRGFAWWPKLMGRNHDSIRVRESSLATGPHLWIDIEELTNLNDPASQLKTATVQLSTAKAEQLVDQLLFAIHGHYQNR